MREHQAISPSALEQREYFPSEQEVRHARADRQNQVVWYLVGMIESLLLMRFIVNLFSVRGNAFTELLHSLTEPFTIPFRGIFGLPPASGGYFDSAAFIAMIVIALLGMGIAALIDLLVRPVRTVA